MNEITYAEVLARVEPIVAARPKATPSCQYFEFDDRYHVDTSRPCCIIGHLFTDELIPVVSSDEGNNSTRLLAISELEVLGRLTRKAKDFLDQLQISQDAHKPWGEALEIAKALVEPMMENGTYIHELTQEGS